MGHQPEYQLSASENRGIVEIVLTGEVNAKTVGSLEGEVIALIKVMNARALLVDVRALKGRQGLVDTYFRVRRYPADRPRVEIAVVDIKEHAYFQSFHETTARNAGQSLRCFTDIDIARAWLGRLPDKPLPRCQGTGPGSCSCSLSHDLHRSYR